MRKMLLKNAFVHDGLGHVAKQDVLVENGEIKQVADSLPGEGEDLSGCHLLPGFIDALSYWGINGSMTEIRPSSEDNDERSDPVTLSALRRPWSRPRTTPCSAGRWAFIPPTV